MWNYVFFGKSLITVSALICFSPLWILWWQLRFNFFVKALSHWLQWYGFSPVWFLWCLIMTFFLLWKHYHNSCIDIVYHEWLFWWTLRCPLCAKSLVTFVAMIWAHCWRNMLVHTMLAYDNSMLTEFYCVLNDHTSLEKHCHKYCICMV